MSNETIRRLPATVLSGFLAWALNPTANVIGCERGRVPLGTIRNTGAFRYAEALTR
jgi:hypothetical protein